MIARLLRRWRTSRADRATGEAGVPREDDVPVDPAVASNRSPGGEADPTQPDQHSTTGTTPNGTFVGRVTGQDVGYAGETGAERRAEADRGAHADPAAGVEGEDDAVRPSGPGRRVPGAELDPGTRG